MGGNADAMASNADTVGSDTDAVATTPHTMASGTAAMASNADTVAITPHPHAPHVHHVPGGYVVDLPPHDDTDRVALGCVFARDLTEAIKRLDLMRAALGAAWVAERATTLTKDPHAP